jgi:hypothetical protein
MATAQDVIVDAFIEGDILDQPGQVPGPNFLTYGLNRLNRLVAQFSTRGLMVWTIESNRYTLTPSQTSYTIGPSGADFTADRPLGPMPGGGIVNANIILTSVSPEVAIPLYIMNDDEWASVRVKDIPTSIPTAIYNDGSFPNSRLYLWGYPNQANDLQLWTRHQISEFASLGTTFSMPPGYQEAITTSLAEAMCSAYKKGVVPPSLAMAARKARAAVMSLNSASPNISNDAAGIGTSNQGGAFFNWLNGQVV